MILDIVQRTPEWYAWRRQGVTASVVSAILGYDDHKTPWRVWAEYVGKIEPEDLSGNPNVRRGERGEDAVRQAFEYRHSEIALPCCAVSDDEPIVRASLDGLITGRVPVEMKRPAMSTHQMVKRYREGSEPYLRYWPQVQHQIYTTGADHGYLVFLCESDREEPYIEFLIERDDRFIDHDLLPVVHDFWNKVQKKKEPSKDPKRDVFIPEGEDMPRWLAAVEEYRRVKSAVEAQKEILEPLEKALRQCEKQLAALMGDYRQAYAFDIQVTRFSRAGSIDYKRLVEDRLPNLTLSDYEAYRRPPGSPQVRVTEKEAPSAEIARVEAQARARYQELVWQRNADTYLLAQW